MEKKFTEGFYPKLGHEKTPWIITKIGIKKAQFIAWLQAQEESDGGYVDIDVCQSKNDANKLYGVLNTYGIEKKRDPYEGYTSPDENGNRIKIDEMGF